MVDVIDPDEAVTLLLMGKVVAVPTDTVYGVAASLAHPSGVAALFTLKGRPSSLALPVLVNSVEQIEAHGVVWPQQARQLARAFWPGAVTIVVPVPPKIANLVGSTSQNAGFRIPNDAPLRSLLSRSGALCVTSANEHGAPPCQSAAQVQGAFADRDELAGVVDGGERGGRVSTVVELNDHSWRIVREGAIGAAEISAVLGRAGPHRR
jgi:L-threonylcarbamoyladenylate synthase